MLTESRHKAVVQLDGMVQVRSAGLPPGATVEVIVLFESEPNQPPLSSLIGTAAGSFADPQTVDSFIRQERDAWDL